MLAPATDPRLLARAVRGGLAAAGGAGTVADALATRERFASLLDQDNLLGARNEVRDFAVNNTNAWAAAYGGGKLGAELGVRRGPYMAFAGMVAGGVVGYVLSDQALDAADRRLIGQQTDSIGRAWQHDGRDWVSGRSADLRDDGVDRPRRQEFSADFDTRRELAYRAANQAVELAMARLPPPRAPFTLPAAEGDSTSSRRADRERDPASGRWSRQVHEAPLERGFTPTRLEYATPERAALLDRQAAEIVENDIARGAAGIAARYPIMQRLHGWDGMDGVSAPPAVTAALDADRLTASNGQVYRRGADEVWRNGSDAATPAMAAELSATREVLRPQLARHEQTVASLPAWTRPTQDQLDVQNLRYQYALRGVEPFPETLEAAKRAVDETRARLGLDPQRTSLAIDPDTPGKLDVRSPIMHMEACADGVIRVVGVTTADDIDRARGVSPAVASIAPARRDDADPHLPDRPGDGPRESRRPLADDPAHPDFATFERIHTWVRGTGHWDEARGRNVAAALYREQAADPLLKRADLVTGGRGQDGAENVFAVDAPWGDREPRFHVRVDGREAAQQPAEQSLEQAEQRRQASAREHQQEQVQQADRRRAAQRVH